MSTRPAARRAVADALPSDRALRLQDSACFGSLSDSRSRASSIHSSGFCGSMRSARSRVVEAPGSSPRVIWACACVTSDWAAGPSRNSLEGSGSGSGADAGAGAGAAAGIGTGVGAGIGVCGTTTGRWVVLSGRYGAGSAQAASSAAPSTASSVRVIARIFLAIASLDPQPTANPAAAWRSRCEPVV